MTEIERFENSNIFEKRKQDHVRIALDSRVQFELGTGLNRVDLIHEALPNFNFSEISLQRNLWGQQFEAPFFISSMTAGHPQSLAINTTLAKAAAEKGWLMGVGSQRRELRDPRAMAEWTQIRKKFPQVRLAGNLGLAQIIITPVAQIQELVDGLQAVALFIHLNPLQECLQPEGTPQFRGGAEALARLAEGLSVPVIVKEVGCGFSQATLQRLDNMGLYAVDVSGKGGTHWGRIEGYRSQEGSPLFEAAQTFKDWGVSTTESLINAQEALKKTKSWASGGVRSGLDAGKLIAMGAEMVGLAKPFLEAAVQDVQAGSSLATDSRSANSIFTGSLLTEKMSLLEHELKIAMFCTGCKDLQELATKRVWKWQT